MYRMCFCLSIISIFPICLIKAQKVDKQFLEKLAVPVDFQNINGNTALFDTLKKYHLIMIGEIHGTKESLAFVEHVARLFTRNHRKVQIGLEIVESDIGKKWQSFSRNKLMKTDFFSKNEKDGRQNMDVASIILRYRKDEMIKLFFYDTEDYGSPRDSLMNINVKNQILAHPGMTTITLSGNIHNMIIPRKGKKTMGCFLVNDQDLKEKDIHIFSINTDYQRGTMATKDGEHEKISVKTVNLPDSPASEYKLKTFLYPITPGRYHAVFYTREITATDY